MFFRRRRTYLDYASATPLREEAKAAYDEAAKLVGNPGSIHAEGVAAAHSLRQSREIIAAELGCKAREIIFTAGLTEANNLAIIGLANGIERTKGSLQGTHWIVGSIEHQSVLECFAEIERRGGTVTYVDPEPNGIIAPPRVTQTLRAETVLVSIGLANSEIGIIQPIRGIRTAIRAAEKKFGRPILVHSDAGQALLYKAVNVHTLGVDLFSLGSGKLYGPRGIGALYVASRADIAPVTIGGGQERGLRAGTEAPALAAGFAAAVQVDAIERHDEARRIQALRDDLAQKILANDSGAVVNGSLRHALPHMLNISMPNINSEYVVLALDRAGIAISTKSACSEGKLNESHVVAALTGETTGRWRAENTLRLSLGRATTHRDIDHCATSLARIVKEMPVA